jgi:hypothetical protein
VKPKQPTPTGFKVDLANAFTYDVVDKINPNHLPLQAPPVPPAALVPNSDPQALARIKSTLMDATVVKNRTAVLVALRGYGLHPGSEGSTLNRFASDPGAVLYGNPLLDQAA